MVVVGLEAGHLHECVALGTGVVGFDHFLHQLRQRDLGRPAQLFARLGRVAEQGFDFGRAVVARIDLHDHVAHLDLGAVAGDRSDDAHFLVALAFETQRDAQLGRGEFDELAHAVLHAGGNDEIFGLVLLQHQPLHFDVVTRMAPVAQRTHVAEIEAVLQAERDAGDGAGDLAGDEGFAADRRFVVEQHAVAGVHAVGLAVIDRDPVGVELGAGVGAARVEGRGFLLRDFLHQTVQLGGRGLIEAGLLFQTQDADRFQDAQRADAVGVGGVFRLFEAHCHVRLGSEVVDLVRLHLLDDAHQRGRVGQVTVVQDELAVIDVRVFVQVVDAVGIEERSAALDAVHLVTLLEQEFSEVGAVLAGDAGDECDLGHI